MPKVTTTDRLIELVRRSELILNEQLAAFIAEQAKDGAGVLPADPTQLAQKFIGSGLISRWQMDQIMDGKYRGFRLGKYTLRDHLGTGGMSSVYLSEHPIMRRPVAIKVLPKKNVAKSSYLERFELEARAVAALDHPNIVRAYDIDNENDTHYLVMEYVEGLDFQRMVEQRGPLQFERAADYIAQAATGLQHAHDAGVVHRDIKPANCLVDKTGTVKVLDMGLAKFCQDETSLSAVHKDSVVGTADYLAPEQAINSSTVDHRADIYGLGGTLYFLLTGHPPFPEGSLTERLMKHQKEEPASIYKDRPDAPATLVDICRRMMRKNPRERIQTGAAVAYELRHWLEGRTGGRESPGGPGRLNVLRPPIASPPMGRVQQLMTPRPKVALPPHPATGDTISASGSDTARIRSAEEIALAPLDEEVGAGKESTISGSLPKSGSDAGLVNLDASVLSQIENEIKQGSSASGSLVDLFEGAHAADVSTSKIIIKRADQSQLPVWQIAGVSVVALLIILVALIVTLF
jgi:serine/threonine-protein kinase